MKEKIIQNQQQTHEIIQELLDDGSDPHALYLIEHHVSSSNFTDLENFAVEAFKLGYEVTDPEEFDDEVENGLICCDVLSEIPLDAALINKQIAHLIELATTFKVSYDGWGTYFEDGEDEYEEEESVIH